MATTLSPPPPTETKAPPPSTGAGGQAAAALGLPSATALVIGSIIGTGVFTMPAVMAGAGTSSILTLMVIAVGAVLLGVLFGQLTKRVPTTDGGMYAYARHEFGDFAGYLTAWCYWITCWAGNAAIVASWVLYVESLFGIDNPSNWVNFGIALTGLWIPAAINLAGVRQMAWFQNVTVVLEVPAPAAGGHVRVVLRPVGQLRPVQRLGREPVRRGQHGCRCGPVLLHRRRVRLDRRRPGARTPAATSAGRRSIGTAASGAALRRRDRRGHGPRAPRRSWSTTARPSSPPSRPCSTGPGGPARSSPSSP